MYDILSQFVLNKILFFILWSYIVNVEILNKIFIIFNLFYVYKETKHKIFYYEKLNCARKETKQ